VTTGDATLEALSTSLTRQQASTSVTRAPHNGVSHRVEIIHEQTASDRGRRHLQQTRPHTRWVEIRAAISKSGHAELLERHREEGAPTYTHLALVSPPTLRLVLTVLIDRGRSEGLSAPGPRVSLFVANRLCESSWRRRSVEGWRSRLPSQQQLARCSLCTGRWRGINRCGPHYHGRRCHHLFLHHHLPISTTYTHTHTHTHTPCTHLVISCSPPHECVSRLLQPHRACARASSKIWRDKRRRKWRNTQIWTSAKVNHHERHCLSACARRDVNGQTRAR
jgi:hypothetical protein